VLLKTTRRALKLPPKGMMPMAFSDPQSVTISGTAISLPRTSSGKNESGYTSGDGLVALTASSSYGKRTRRVIRIDHSKITADPFISTTNVKVSMSTYLVFDVPPAGYTNAEAKAVYDGFVAALNASSGALITKLLGGES
jgi:hypothetical protein